MNEKEKQDIMDAEAILVELNKLLESEKAETEPGEEAHVRELEEAISHVKAFVSAEEKEEHVEIPEGIEMPSEKAEVIDTGTLTGPMSNLKNFLIKKSRTSL